MQRCGILLCIASLCATARTAAAQTGRDAPSPGAPESITVRSNLVLVPAFVKTKQGENVFALQAGDFQVTDDGAPQMIRLEQDANEQPIALMVLVQNGGRGARFLDAYRDLDPMLEAIIGAVPHVVAVAAFDSQVRLQQNFSADTAKAAAALTALQPGDDGAAILDGLTFATEQLAKQQVRYRRAVLLLTETIDAGSQVTLNDALRAVDDTNTAIYSFAFSSTRADLKHEGAKLPNPFSPTKYSKTLYKAGGCMSREPGADPDANGSRAKQALDCADDLVPPLRIARMAYLAAIDGMHQNVPETVARLTGGEYFPFKDGKSLRERLISIVNDVHNQYLLSFQPTESHAGMHALAVIVAGRTDLIVKARNAYWINENEKR